MTLHEIAKMSKRKANAEDKVASKTKMDIDGEDDDSGSDVS